jgi:gluconolactonase
LTVRPARRLWWGEDKNGPNGRAFSPDGSKLIIIESGARPRNILTFDVDGARLRDRRVLVECGTGTPDGFRVDVDGNLWSAWGIDQEQDGSAS